MSGGRGAGPSRDPRAWGPAFWQVMHTVAAFYPDHPTSEDMSNARNFYLSLVGLLPCKACADHYGAMLMRFPIENALLSKMELVRWCWHLHNEVNVRNGSRGPTFAEYVESLDAARGGRGGGGGDARIGYLLVGVAAAALVLLVVRALARRAACASRPD